MKDKDLEWYVKNKITDEELRKFDNLGLSSERICSVKTNIINMSIWNECDDDFGIPQMNREDVINDVYYITQKYTDEDLNKEIEKLFELLQ